MTQTLLTPPPSRLTPALAQSATRRPGPVLGYGLAIAVSLGVWTGLGLLVARAF